ncbi:MAG TPA: LptA/OstA family protein [Smithellaceae bacterium]|nr:LptA/OstA family protein [Smithellaceae bacterium]HRS89643.1 LptA/OstA family protein [Smithellaceae bacterium]HRV25801.1 LptA/OstA family protein [Smithellaceae bacterium]
MNNRKICAYFLGIMLLAPLALNAQEMANPIKEDVISREEPIEINSDRMDAYNQEKLVKFSGHAVVKQGDKLLKADELRLYYKEEPKKQVKKGKKPFDASGIMDRISATGNVSSTQGERTVSGDEATYYHETGQVIITGNVVMREGKNVVKGCRVTIYLNENKGKVEQCEPGTSERVQAIIYPQDIKSKEIN